MEKTFVTSDPRISRNLYVIGGIAALAQWVAILSTIVVMGLLGEKPASAAEYFAAYQANPVQAFLQGDFLVMLMIALYLGTVPALYLALRSLSPLGAGFAALFSLITAMGAIYTDASFSLLHLGGRYAAATSEAQRVALAAAWEAVMASDLWNGTAAYLGGIFLQGSGVVFSIIMLRSRDFSRVTAVSGLLGNGLDLTQHILHLFLPSIAALIQMVMGIFYLVWFPMLARDFFRMAKGYKK